MIRVYFSPRGEKIPKEPRTCRSIALCDVKVYIVGSRSSQPEQVQVAARSQRRRGRTRNTPNGKENDRRQLCACGLSFALCFRTPNEVARLRAIFVPGGVCMMSPVVGAESEAIASAVLFVLFLLSRKVQIKSISLLWNKSIYKRKETHEPFFQQ